MKLLAKTPEDRYQTAGGVERDLRHCLAEWEASRRIDDFRLGLQDTPNRLLIPEKLYERAREIDALLASFNKVVATGRISTSATSLTPLWRKPFRASSDRF